MLDVSAESAPAVREALVHRVPARMKEVVMTAGEQLRAEGRMEGRIEGRAQGRAEVLGPALLKMVRLKFGAIPAGFEERVKRTDPDTLDRWSDRILEAERFEDLFG